MKKMILFAFILLIFNRCSAESSQNEDLLRRNLEHRNNLALLTSIHLGDDKNLNALSPNPATIATALQQNRNIPVTLNLQGAYSTQNPQPVVPQQLPLVPPPLPVVPQQLPLPGVPQQLPLIQPQLTNDIIFNYAPAYRFPLDNIQIGSLENQILPNNLVQFPYDNVQIQTNPNLITNNLIQTLVPQQTNLLPQVTKELPVPQQLPVNVVRTVQVPVQVRVPVEVPKPYEVRVPHPVPVPVHIKVPVTVEKPYPVQVTKTVAVPVEKPVYIRVPQPVEVPVPQPYPVGVPQPIQIKVPVVVRFAEGNGNLSNELLNLDGTPFVPSVSNQNLPAPPLTVGTTSLTPAPAGSTPNGVVPTTNPPVTVTTNKPQFTGNGLLPPPPPAKLTNSDIKSVIGGLLNSYVASKSGGVYRRSTKFQTPEYQKTW